MPRAPFNTTADFLEGPDTLAPGALRFTGVCRVVPADGISWVDTGVPPVVAWITVEMSRPIGGWDGVRQIMQPGYGDTVVVPSGGVQQYFVMVVDEVLWQAQPLYYRAHVAYLPRPVAPGPFFSKVTRPVAGNVLVLPLGSGVGIIPGMRVYCQALGSGFIVVTAVALPNVTISVAGPPIPVPESAVFA